MNFDRSKQTQSFLKGGGDVSEHSISLFKICDPWQSHTVAMLPTGQPNAKIPLLLLLGFCALLKQINSHKTQKRAAFPNNTAISTTWVSWTEHQHHHPNKHQHIRTTTDEDSDTATLRQQWQWHTKTNSWKHLTRQIWLLQLQFFTAEKMPLGPLSANTIRWWGG